MGIVSAEALACLRGFDPPTICKTIDWFGVRPRVNGFLGARIRAGFPDVHAAVRGAATATVRSSAPPPPGSDVWDAIETQAAHIADLSGPPIVDFQDPDSLAAAASAGKSCAAHTRL